MSLFKMLGGGWFPEITPKITPETILDQKLASRKQVRIAEQERARISYWKRERALHRRDPLLTKFRPL